MQTPEPLKRRKYLHRMHEYPITQQIIKIAEERAIASQARKVTRVTLVVGDLSGFIGDSIQLYFDVLSKGTLLEGAEIKIKTVRPLLKCESCGTYFERNLIKRSFECPNCGGNGIPSEIGKEFYIEDIEIEKTEIKNEY